MMSDDMKERVVKLFLRRTAISVLIVSSNEISFSAATGLYFALLSAR